MMTCHECGEQFRNGSNDKRCKSCLVAYDVVAISARNAVTRAMIRGDLPRLRDANIPCVDCGKRANRYDHRDYLKPLDVEPVCHGCNLRRGPALPCLSRLSDPALIARCDAARERRRLLRLSFGAAA